MVLKLHYVPYRNNSKWIFKIQIIFILRCYVLKILTVFFVVKRDGTVMKTQYNIANLASYHRVIIIVPSRHRVFSNVPSRFHHCAIAFTPSYHRVFTIVESRHYVIVFYHRIIAFSPSYLHVFTIVPSCFHHRNIALRSH